MWLLGASGCVSGLCLSSVSGICFFRKKQMWLLGASPHVSWVISFISEWHLLFPEKANVTTRASGSVSGLISVICEWHLLFAEKANVTPWPLLVFQNSYLSSVSDICFLRKKQMWLLGASGCVSGLISVICEWHLLFPKEANVTLVAAASVSGGRFNRHFGWPQPKP